MSKWMDTAESALTQFQVDTGISYDFERWQTDPNQPAASQLPDRYIVYFLVDDEGKTYADGQETSHEPRVQVSFYTRKKSDMLTVPDKIEQAFVAAGFTRGPVGHVPYQTGTGHYGWRRDFYFYERR
ncbi:MAG TPA: hypothetical protein DG942_00635 [Ruminococcaceae bacterium]|nr:hypothetical protein [Oscillospiraceae bacterium]